MSPSATSLSSDLIAGSFEAAVAALSWLQLRASPTPFLNDVLPGEQAMSPTAMISGSPDAVRPLAPGLVTAVAAASAITAPTTNADVLDQRRTIPRPPAHRR